MRNQQTLADILKIGKFLTKHKMQMTLKNAALVFSLGLLLLPFANACVSAAAPALVTSAVSTDSPTPLPTVSPPAVSSGWQPQIGARLQIQYADYPPDLSVEADIFSLDLFETSIEDIAALHAQGKRVICYLNTGSWEKYRPDAADFPEDVIGKDYEVWPGEKWLDIRHYEDFAALMQARFDLAVEKGCDGIDADNMQNYDEDTALSSARPTSWPTTAGSANRRTTAAWPLD